MSRKPFPVPALGALAAAVVGLAALLACSGVSRAGTAGPTRAALEQRLAGTVQPFLRSYCAGCHGKQDPKAQLNLTAYPNLAAVVDDYPHWALLLEKLEAKQMPPAGARQPPAAQREAVLAWVRAMRRYEAERNAGDPGPVPARRLSNAEYDYTIRDLTGVDLHPTKEFPVDPANQEGFDNSGESLTVSPALMKKYFQAARSIADCLVMNSTGIAFAPHPVLVETDRDKYCILRIVDFYKRQPTDYADYFLAAWKYRSRAALGMPQATLQSIAAQAKVSPKYLETVWTTLTAPAEKVGPMAKLQAMWNALPAPDKAGLEDVRGDCREMRDWVVSLRKSLACKFDNLRIPPPFTPGGQIFVLWKDRAYASHRRDFNERALQPGGVPPTITIPARRRGNRTQPERTVTAEKDEDLYVPQDQAARAPYLAGFKRFCSVFPDAFYISERGRMFVDEPTDMGRLLSAGLHNAMGYFRDDTPLMELVLDDRGRDELDRLWTDFDFVAQIPERMHLEFFHYERAESGVLRGPEFDFAKAEDADATSDAKINRLAAAYREKMQRGLAESGGDPVALKAVDQHFNWVRTNLRHIETMRKDAEPVQLGALVDFARRAYRRPLPASERESVVGFYRDLRENENVSHEDAMRDTLVSILMSPNFLFRVDLEDAAVPVGRADERGKSAAVRGRRQVLAASTKPAPAGPAVRRPAPAGWDKGVRPLSDYALASRLSYFLWSSMPDEEVLSHAAAGDLHRPEILLAQARRMLQDPKARGLALEFGGNWLDFRRFEEHNAVDRERFPTFDDALREAMFQEPLRFLLDGFQHNRSALDMLYGDYTFVNAPLAKHYGMTDVKVPGDEWVRVDQASRYSRGGLLPMGVFLTMNAPGLRTSPVKRGYWVVRRVLGERIPPPPPTVPELPKDEGKLGNKTLRQALEEHRANPACAGCHARFDSFGLVFENYGPVGELRTKDLGGKPVDTRAAFPGGSERAGLSGLREYLQAKRQNDFLENLCRKLLSYGLGRTLLPSDEPLLLQMRRRLAAGGYKIDTLIDAIVTSPQFLNRRAAPNAGVDQWTEWTSWTRRAGTQAPATTAVRACQTTPTSYRERIPMSERDTSRPIRPVSRRMFLRGAGVVMALPWLESAPVWGAAPDAKEASPRRLVIQFMGTGVNPDHWWAKGQGASMELSKSLQPLEPLKTKINVINGLFNKPSTGVGIHPGMTGNILSGMPLTKGAVLHGGTSMDQVLAGRLGQDCVQPSLVLACEQPLTGYHETNFSMAYSSHISWATPDSPVPCEVYPSLAFDSLFENSGSRRTESILDRVREEAAGLRKRISSSDRAKLDEYLTSVREVEERAQRMRGDLAKAADRARDRGKPLPAMKRPDNGLPEDIRDHMRLMCDIVALALQTDKTRIASMLMCRDLSGLFYPFLNVREAHHLASHHDTSDEYERITSFYVSQLAYLAGKLQAMPEGQGTVLDSTCILWLSNMFSGSRHDNTRLPIVTVGGLGGTLAAGRVLEYGDKGDENRKLCSLHLSLMDRMGVNLPHFGDAETRLAGL